MLNIFCRCNFQWIAGEWEPCSKTCGLNGVQFRELYCVPNHVLNVILFKHNGTVMKDPWKHMVNPAKCPDTKPISMRSCNQFPCEIDWNFGEWSQVNQFWNVQLNFDMFLNQSLSFLSVYNNREYSNNKIIFKIDNSSFIFVSEY